LEGGSGGARTINIAKRVSLLMIRKISEARSPTASRGRIFEKDDVVSAKTEGGEIWVTKGTVPAKRSNKKVEYEKREISETYLT